MEPDRSWGAVVFDHRNRYLLIHHAGGRHWDHPKGHADPNETPRDTALREIREEAQINAEIIDGFQTEVGWILPNGRPKKVVYFLARRTGECPAEGPEGEILGKTWLPYTQAREKITYDTGKEVLDRAEEFLNLRQRSIRKKSGTAAHDELSGDFQ